MGNGDLAALGRACDGDDHHSNVSLVEPGQDLQKFSSSAPSVDALAVSATIKLLESCLDREYFR